MKMKNAMSMFAALSLATGCVASTQPDAEPYEDTAELAAELGAPAASDVPAEEQDVAEASMALGTCDDGSLQCCNSLTLSSPTTLAQLSGLLGISLPYLPGYIGLSCTPLSIGSGGNSCSAQPACCTNTNFGGLVALGCTPVNLNL